MNTTSVDENAEEQEGNNLDELSDEQAKEEYISTIVVDKIVKYVTLDNLIKREQEEFKKKIKPVKDYKDKLEKFLIEYLNKDHKDFIEVGGQGTDATTLIKTEVKTKAAPKMGDISLCLLEGFEKHEIYQEEDDRQRVVKDLIDSIDAWREIKTRTYLKRTKGPAR